MKGNGPASMWTSGTRDFLTTFLPPFSLHLFYFRRYIFSAFRDVFKPYAKRFIQHFLEWCVVYIVTHLTGQFWHIEPIPPCRGLLRFFREDKIYALKKFCTQFGSVCCFCESYASVAYSLYLISDFGYLLPRSCCRICFSVSLSVTEVTFKRLSSHFVFAVVTISISHLLVPFLIQCWISQSSVIDVFFFAVLCSIVDVSE